MTEIQNYIRKQKEVLDLLNSNKSHLINIDVEKYKRKQRLIAYLLFVFTFPLPFYNLYLKRYHMVLIEFVYILLPLIVYYLFQDIYDQHPTAKDVGTYYIAIALSFFWVYDLFTISSAVSKNARERKEQMYREEGILSLSEMIQPKLKTHEDSIKKFWTPVIKKFNELVRRNKNGTI